MSISRAKRLRPLVNQRFSGSRRHLYSHRGRSWRKRSDLNLIASTGFKSMAELAVLAVNRDYIKNIGRLKASPIVCACVANKMDYCCYLSSIINARNYQSLPANHTDRPTISQSTYIYLQLGFLFFPYLPGQGKILQNTLNPNKDATGINRWHS